MSQDKLTKILKYITVVGVGLYTFWNFSFFRPFSAQYPPTVPYTVTSSFNGSPDTVLAKPGYQYDKGPIGEFWLGEHYRFLWTTPIKVKVLNLEKEGLQITKRGGGMQTTSFTLTNKDGKEFSLRSVDKDPVSVIPTFLWPTVVGSFIRDQVSATDPYALLPVLSLTEKVGIGRAEAKLVFVLSNDPAFRKFSLKRSGFYYLSQKYGIPQAPDSLLANELQIYTTAGMFQELEKQPGSSIDTTLFLKCRLFDLFIGDWDRHGGQWDWVSFSVNGNTVFKPFPKDRDQAFGYYADGVIPFVLSRDFVVRKITSFTPHYQDIAGFSENGSELDNRFLKNITKEMLTPVVKDLQNRLRDKEFLEAIKLYPEPVRKIVAAEKLYALQARREKLPQAATEFIRIVHSRP